jgi:hypothetical protein
MGVRFGSIIGASVALLGASLASGNAQAATEGSPAPAELQVPRLETADEAVVQDAAEYARLHSLSLDEAVSRLRAQEASVAATDRLRQRYRDRLTGIAIEHEPEYRIVVLLAGAEPVRAEFISAAGRIVPIVYRTGARATGEQLIAAITSHRDEIRKLLSHVQGMGVDPRTGELVVMLQTDKVADAQGHLPELEAITGVPVRVDPLNAPARDLAIEGGSRLTGTNPQDGRNYACTTGFVVTDNSRNGIVTAAHCPDNLVYHDPRGGTTALTFVGEWGARTQDVQVHVTDAALVPEFFVDSKKTLLRSVDASRPRASTRAGDIVCHRGETTGYSCATVELVDYAPPGDLCGGPCEPVWVAVSGPTCKSGDSGGPIFLGTTAFGIVKGGNYAADGSCVFYYYMSTDYLPTGWSLLYQTRPDPPTATAPQASRSPSPRGGDRG